MVQTLLTENTPHKNLNLNQAGVRTAHVCGYDCVQLWYMELIFFLILQTVISQLMSVDCSGGERACYAVCD